ncbi:MAG: NACHT domain-containing protein, partial [Christensenellaceae bacterium]
DGAPWILIPKGILPSSGDYSEYLDNAYAKYNKMKTLLYSDTPREFYKFYVCNDISQKIFLKRYTYRTITIHDATAETLKDCSNFILISGTGGLGKSMMMRHLLLDAIDSYEESKQIPIFIPLKDYDDSYANLLDYVYEKFESLGGCDCVEDFTELLYEGSCLLLFDGLDEIKSDYRKKFEHDLDSFADKYSDNMFVISSRPTGSFVSLHRFTVLDLCPFTKEQAIKLIENLDFRTDEPNIKEKFKTELENTLFITHREFTQNPLLLTIMLMTYEQFAEIPSKMHIFYHEAYIALSQKHDASKGAFKRVLKTGLTANQFADYFAEFCARSYRDEKFEFTDILFDKYFNDLHEQSRGSLAVSASDFRDDLVENMCLMFYESGKYHFTHRSFQEYFCALYFSKQKDKTLQPIGDFFEKKQTRGTDKTFSMLYDMIPEKIDEYIFEPFLKSLFEECDLKNGYWTFLETMYPVLYYEEGETDGFTFNDPQSFLYGFIIRKQLINAYLSNDDLSLDERFITNEWVYLDDLYQDPEIDTDRLIELNEVPSEYTREFGEPDVVGRNYEIEIETLLSDSQRYKDIIERLEHDDFPLMTEFKKAREYFNRLLDSHFVTSDDLFDLFQ